MKSALGKLLIPLYYVGAIMVCVIFFVIIFCKAGALAGFIFAAVLGIAIGILGGELEYRDHLNEIYNKHIKRTGIDKQGMASKILPFQGEKSCKIGTYEDILK
jgi:hypothetical protein